MCLSGIMYEQDMEEEFNEEEFDRCVVTVSLPLTVKLIIFIIESFM